ncbi:MAG: ParB/RepB/Spo0J family partition protein, partial [Treponema sp.]|nr:ParB/RepB/Spo0J family partition protein [Treponema sp.]
QLVNSIREHGIIEPPLVRKLKEGGYKVVAGRRRIAALRQLAQEDDGDYYRDVYCIALEADDSRSDEELALTENVNRLDMHPLDEAALFSRMAERGAPVEAIARYYARSPSAIYQRLRLQGLTEKLKGMFRDGKINIAGAAVLAELPEEDQEKFFSQYGEYKEIFPYKISDFIYARQKYVLKKSMTGCDVCSRRTHNSGNSLFEEYNYLSDVCLEPDCYRRQWSGLIELALAEQGANEMLTDQKIYFADDISAMLFKQATHAEFFFRDETVRFEVLKEKDYGFTGETKRKKDACWMIREPYAGDGGIIAVRVGYSKKAPIAKGAAAATEDGRLVEQYGREELEAAAAERGTSAAEIAKALKEKKELHFYDFKEHIKDRVAEKAIARRIETEKSGAEPVRDYFSMFLDMAEIYMYNSDAASFDERKFSKQQKRWLRDLEGERSLAEISADLPEEVQRLFHFLLLNFNLANEVFSLDELKNIDKASNTFWKYAQMTEAEYRELYLLEAKEVIVEELAEKPAKKKKKSKTGPDDSVSQTADTVEEDNYPFEPDPDPDIEIDDAAEKV